MHRTQTDTPKARVTARFMTVTNGNPVICRQNNVSNSMCNIGSYLSTINWITKKKKPTVSLLGIGQSRGVHGWTGGMRSPGSYNEEGRNRGELKSGG